MMPTDSLLRETIGDMANPLGLHGIEFIEHATSVPQALGQVLETMGFRPAALHRSRGVLRRSVPLPNRMRLKAATPS